MLSHCCFNWGYAIKYEFIFMFVFLVAMWKDFEKTLSRTLTQPAITCSKLTKERGCEICSKLPIKTPIVSAAENYIYQHCFMGEYKNIDKYLQEYRSHWDIGVNYRHFRQNNSALKKRIEWDWLISAQCCYYVEISPLICYANQTELCKKMISTK